jgi:hypothetical protein
MRYTQLCRECSTSSRPAADTLDAASPAARPDLTEQLGYEMRPNRQSAVVQALRDRSGRKRPGQRGQNAEMLGWTDNYLHTCPYP